MKKMFSFSLAVMVSGLLVSLPAQTQPGSGPSLTEKGQYLATAGDCAACHTASGGKPFAGGLAIATPIGHIVATNITPSKIAGIGNYTLADFEKAVRHGVRKDGANLYPAMPYTAYAKITDKDIQALYAYFMHGVKPVDEKAQATALPFPFNIRLSMAGWNLIFARGTPFVADTSKSTEWNRGAYLAEGLAHCSTCHTPRNMLMAEESDKSLGGASLGTWFAPNITSDVHAGIGGWSQHDLASYLTTGQSDNGSQAGGPMLEAISKSFSKLSAGDIKALTTYLRDVPAQSDNATSAKASSPVPVLSDIPIMNGTAPEGAQLYETHCSTCHQLSGQGSNGIPALYNNAGLRRPVADNAVMAVLDGLEPVQGQVMPAFHGKMNDQQVSVLVNYLFKTWGNPAVQTTPERVKSLREGGPPSPLLAIARDGMIAAGIVILVMIVAGLVIMSRRKKR